MLYIVRYNFGAMKITKFVVGLIVLVLAALMLADGVLTYIADTTLFTLDQFKLAVGFVLVVLAGAYFEESRE
jgi:hypothetical protein